MKISRASFLGVNGLADRALDFTDPSTGKARSLVVVTGLPASGKTRLLEAIVAGKEAVAPYATMLDARGWARGPTEPAKIALEWELGDDERAWAGLREPRAVTEALFVGDERRAEIDDGLQALLERYEHDPKKPKLEYFPANRQLLPYGPAHGLDAVEQQLHRAGREPRKYSFVPRLLEALRGEPQRAARFADLLTALSTTARWAPEKGAGPACIASGPGPARPPHELSASEADAVILAATSTLLELSGSVVLIDRPDLHVTPNAAPALVGALARLGEDNQVILATSSRELLASVEPGAIVRLEVGS